MIWREVAIFESLFPNNSCHPRRGEQSENDQSDTSFAESGTSFPENATYFTESAASWATISCIIFHRYSASGTLPHGTLDSTLEILSDARIFMSLLGQLSDQEVTHAD